MARISATRILVVGLVMLASGKAAWADFVNYSNTSGTYSASVTFETSGSNLIITLTNTSTADAYVPTDILTGVFFSSPDTTLTRVSAIVAPGSSTYINTTNTGVTDVSNQWAYLGNISVGGANSGISSTGLGVFGKFDLFAPQAPGDNAPDGLGYGITSEGDLLGTYQGGLDGRPLTQNSVVFTLSGWTGDLSQIGNVFFQYGTALNEPQLPGTPTPEPATMLLMGLGVAGLAWYRKQGARA